MPGSRARPWTEPEIAWLRANSGKVDVYEAAATLGRTRPAVWQHGGKIGVTFLPKKRVFRSRRSIAWSENETHKFLELAGKVPAAEIARQLGRSLAAVQMQAVRHKVSFNVEGNRPWTKSELDKLMDCERLTVEELAEELGRTVSAVATKMYVLGYRALCGYHTVRSAVRETGYSPSQLQRARRATGQKWRWSKMGGSHGRYLITQDQLEGLCEWLKKETWKKDRKEAA